MKLSLQLRLYRNSIADAGVTRFMKPNATMYAAGCRSLLEQQQKAMALLAHLEVAPGPGAIKPLRKLWLMEAGHPPLKDFFVALAGSRRPRKIELIRRFGATVGMVHSIRSTGTGDLLRPDSVPVARKIAAKVKADLVLLALRGKDLSSFAGLADEIIEIWGEAGGTLVGNWGGFPPLAIWDNGLMIMNLSGANYWEPLFDLANFHPQDIGLETGFFWEYFLQGYEATCELPTASREKIEAVYKLNLLRALARERGIDRALADCKNRWWERA